MKLKNLFAVLFLFLGIGGVVALALVLANTFGPPRGRIAAKNKQPPPWQPPIPPLEIDKPAKPTEPVLVVNSPFPKMPSLAELLRLRKERLAAAMKFEEQILKTPRKKSDETGAFLFVLEPRKGIRNGYVSDVSYSPDGRLVVCRMGIGGVFPNPSWIEIWDLLQRKKVYELEESRNNRLSMPVFSPDGKTLVAFCRDVDDPIGEIVFWDAKNGRQIRSITAPGLAIDSGLAFTPNGSMLVAKCYDFGGGQVRWLGVKNGKEVARLLLTTDCTGLAFSPDGRRFATASRSAVQVWSFPSCKQLQSFAFTEPRELQFSPSGNHLALAVVNKICLIDMASEQINESPANGAVSRLCFLGDGKMIAHNHLGGGPAVTLLESPSLKEVTSVTYGVTYDFSFSPNGRVMAYRDIADRLAAYDVEALVAARDINAAENLMWKYIGGSKWRFSLWRKGKYLDVTLTDSARSIDLAKAATLPWVRRLSLSGNVSDVGLEVLPKFKHVSELSFYQLPPVTGAGLEHVKSLQGVEKLRLAELKNVGDDGLRHIGTLKNLRELTIESMPHLTEKGFAQLKSLPALRKLFVRDCNLSEESFAQLGKIKQLETFEFGKDIDDKRLAKLVDLVNLKELTLRGSQVTDEGLKHVGKLSGLRQLDLSNLPITESGLDSLKRLTQLQVLVLAGTKVKKLDALRDLTKLELVNLNSTLVSDAALANLSGLKRLTTIWLDKTRNFHGSGLAHLKNCPKLNSLFLEKTYIDDDGLQFLGALKNLSDLSVPKRTTDKGMRHIRLLESLKSLYLSGTKVTDKGLVHIADLDQISVLGLDRTKINGSGLVHLVNMPNLRDLDLGESKIEDANLVHVAKLKGLRLLNLYGTNISDAGLKNLHGMTQLRYLHLENTRVTNAGAAELRRALPKTEVTLPLKFDE